MDKPLPDDFDPYEVYDEMSQERIAGEAAAGLGTVGSWALWGYSLTQVNELLTTLSLVAATIASIAATVYYVTRRNKP